MQRLKTRAQFQAVMDAGATVSRTEHFALHRLALAPPDPGQAPSPGPGERSQALLLFSGAAQPWIGAILPKRWARRAVTRNAIKR